MSALPFTSMLLWTEKGRTFVPLVRGSCFLLKYNMTGFYNYHVVAAGHCALPPKYPDMWPEFTNIRGMPQRNIYDRILVPDPAKEHRVVHEIDMRTTMKLPSGMDVAFMSMLREEQHAEFLEAKGLTLPEPLEVDTDHVGSDEQVVLLGFDMQEEAADASGLSLRCLPKRLEGLTKAAVTTNNGFGTCILTELDEEMPQGMCGGPVLRASNGKCIGVIAGRVGTEEPREKFDFSKEQPVVDPRINVGNLPQLRENERLRAGFTPIREWNSQLRMHEGLQ